VRAAPACCACACAGVSCACAAPRQVSKAADLANQTAAEAVGAIRTVAAFGMEAALAAQFAAELRAPWRQFRRTALVTGLAFGASMAVLFMARALRTRLPPAPCA